LYFQNILKIYFLGIFAARLAFVKGYLVSPALNQRNHGAIFLKEWNAGSSKACTPAPLFAASLCHPQ
jgi:hypothetical protein